ncbi:MAG: MotA/TolQ/ExbB proton channel family protein [Chthoniobacterales bacterium]|nr:MotA/TolQ/ExbB proton channel family protein [Chthoniobacterales bacterium]
MENLPFHDIFLRGGVVMWPLLFCSVLGAAVILDRAVFFLRLRSTNLGRLENRLVDDLRRGDAESALRVARSSEHPVARVAASYLQNLERPPSLRTEIMRCEGSLQLERVEKRLRVLAAISHLAPLLGLLGTVTGMVAAFATIEGLKQAASPADLAGGIWEALLTTVFGLVVAIPCMAAYHGFEGMADKIARRMQFVVTSLDEALGRTGGDLGAEVSAEEEEWNVVRS